MSYQVLARKWRPQNFKEMVGQQHVLRALINALEEDRLHHAYLFTGTRGVGKTTIARILAKCLNCETGVTSEPCGECSSCKSILEGSFVDLIEVDAASRTKVEDTRELLDNVQYAPTRGRFKVYLIDEVHMLTGHSFNALLKTLEEPPPHVKFLFATTDPQKLPVTILSRCLQFNLKRMPVDMISGHLQYLTKQESIPSDEPSLKLIARAADGSMRDALSLLDQSIAFGNGELKEADVREMLGTISHEPLLALLKCVSEGNGAEIIQQVEELAGVTPDFEAATDALIASLHQIAVQQVVPDAQQDDDGISELADLLTKEDVQLYYQIALNGRRDLALSPDPRSGFEMLLLRMLAFRPLQEGMVAHSENTQTNDVKSEEIVNTQTNQDQENKKKTLKPEDIEAQNQATAILSTLQAGSQHTKPPQDEPRQSRPQEVSQPIEQRKKIVEKVVDGVNVVAEADTFDDVPWETLPEELNIDAVDSGNLEASNPEISSSERNIIEPSSPEPNSPELGIINSDENRTSEIKTEEANTPLPVAKKPQIVENSSKAEGQDNKEAACVDKHSPWHEIVPILALNGRAAELIKHCLFESKDNGIISLTLDKSSDGLLAESTKQEIQTALATFYAEEVTLKLSVSEIKVDSRDNVTPAQRTARDKVEKQQRAEHNIESDPFVIELQNRFGAQVVPGSVQPK